MVPVIPHLKSLYLLNRLSKTTKSKKYLQGHFGDDDGILLSADRTPNLRGALYSGFTSTYPKDNLEKLNNDLKKGEIETLLVVNEDLLSSGVEAESLRKSPSFTLEPIRTAPVIVHRLLFQLSQVLKRGYLYQPFFFSSGF